MLGEFNSNNPVVFLFKLATRVFVTCIQDYSLLFVATLAPYSMHIYEENLHIILLIDTKILSLRSLLLIALRKLF